MNYSQVNFQSIKDNYKDIFAALERTLSHFGIDYYLIGAQSRDVWTNHLSLVKRTTRDIDFAVLVGDRAKWDLLVEHLTTREGFAADPKRPYRFYFGANMLDLVPFGDISSNEEVQLYNPPTTLSVYGCREVTEDAVLIDGKYHVITLSGLCIMKLIAFDEKPDDRAKDYEDYLLIMRNYAEIAGDELYTGRHGDLIEGDFEFSNAGARMLGRNMRLTLDKNERLKSRIVRILQGKLMRFSPEEIDQMYAVNDKGDPTIQTLKMTGEVIRGILD